MRASVIIPVYKSHTTIQRCIAGLQCLEHESFEVIFVDSSPDDRSSEIIRRSPQFRLIRPKERMLMHAARNAGIQAARGDVIVFTDPDCVVAPDWLSELDKSLKSGHSVVGGGIALYPGGVIDQAAHIVKFWRWFPGGEDRYAEDLATANFAVKRDALLSVGLFKPDLVSGDTELSHRLRRGGYGLYFNSRAVVQHIHEVTFKALVKERFIRGMDFGRMRSTLPEWSAWKSLAGVFAAPLLALRQLHWKFLACKKHQNLRGFLRTQHIILCCDLAWTFGAALGYITTLHQNVHRRGSQVPG